MIGIFRPGFELAVIDTGDPKGHTTKVTRAKGQPDLRGGIRHRGKILHGGTGALHAVDIVAQMVGMTMTTVAANALAGNGEEGAVVTKCCQTVGLVTREVDHGIVGQNAPR